MDCAGTQYLNHEFSIYDSHFLLFANLDCHPFYEFRILAVHFSIFAIMAVPQKHGLQSRIINFIKWPSSPRLLTQINCMNPDSRTATSYDFSDLDCRF